MVEIQEIGTVFPQSDAAATIKSLFHIPPRMASIWRRRQFLCKSFIGGLLRCTKPESGVKRNFFRLFVNIPGQVQVYNYFSASGAYRMGNMTDRL